MTESVQPNKVSFHVTFKKHQIIKKEFLPEDEYELFSGIVGTENFKYIDDKVYGNKLWFRLPYGKVGNTKPYAHIPFAQHGVPINLSEYPVSIPDDEETKDYSNCLARLNRQWKQIVKQYEKEAYTKEEIVIDTDVTELVKTILDKLDLTRFKNKKEWFLLAMMMKTYGLTVEEFCDYSRRSGYAKYSETSCKNTFQAVSATFKHLGLLKKWVKEDQLDVNEFFPTYSPMLKEMIKLTHDLTATKLTDHNINQVIKKVYGDNLFYSGIGWVHWNELKHMWEVGDDASIFNPMITLLTMDVITYYQTKKDKLKEEEEKDGEKDNSLKIKILTMLLKNLYQLQNVKRIKGILEYAKGFLLDNERLKKFNIHSELFSFSNGITYHMKTKETYPTRKEDCILSTCGYPFPERSQDDIDIVMDLLKSIFRPEDLDYNLSCLSCLLYGKNTNEMFLIWKGIGRNGKGVLNSVLQKTLGNYHQTLSSEELTEDSKGKGRANSEIAQAIFSRCLMTSEPDPNSNVSLKTDRIKLLTGNDPISTREMYGKAFTYEPQFTLVCQCNSLPKLSKCDDALSKRMRFIEFPYQFTEEPIRDYQRKIDTELKEKITKDLTYRNGLLFILFDYYFTYQGKIPKNETANEMKQDELDRSNPITEFLDQYEPSDKFIRIKPLFEQYQEKYPTISLKEFKQYLFLTSLKTEEDKSNGLKVYISKK
jgi:hypothetical protein